MSRAQLLTAICVTALALLVKDAQTCSLGLPALGWIVPGFDRALEVGESIDMLCFLNETQNLVPNATSQDLRFFINNMPIFDTRVSVLSERAIGLHTEHSEIASSTIDNKYRVTCKIHDKELCTKYVTVGYKPLSISNFSCISYNWENLTCTWDEPENPVETKYTLSYSPRASDSSCLSRVSSYVCPNATKTPGSCTWSVSTNPPYRLTSKYLLFSMRMINTLVNETITQCLTSVVHSSIILPSKMENLTVSNITASSACLSWKVPEPLSQIPTTLNFTLNYNVSFKPLTEWTTKTEFFIDPAELNITGSGKTEKNVQISLPFAYVDYEVKVRAKSSTSEDLWSDPATVRFTTAADVPCPVTNLTAGSFRFIEKSLLVFWNPVTPDCQRGKLFEYEVTFESENETRKTEFSRYDAFTELKSLSSSKEARVTIRSKNEFYYSEPSSTLFIPSDNQRPSEPKEVLSVSRAPHQFEVLWSSEKNSGQPIDNFTIFWCAVTRTGNCNGTMDSVQLPAETYSHNITLPLSLGTDLMFFVSSERGSFSSGMQPACNIKHSNETDEVNGFTVESNANNSDLNVKWKPIYCTKRKGIILGYRIQYSVASKPEMENFVVSNTEYSYTITDMQPNSNYCVQAAVISRDGEGEWTDFVCAVSGSTPSGLKSWLGITVAASAVTVIAVGLFFGYRHWKRVEEAKNQEAFVPWKLEPRETIQWDTTFHSTGNSSHRNWLTDHSTLSSLPNSYETESLDRSTQSLNAVSSNSTVEDTQSLNSSCTSKETVLDVHSTISGLSKPYVQLGSAEVVRSPEDVTINYSGKSESRLPNEVSSDSAGETLITKPYVQLGELQPSIYNTC